MPLYDQASFKNSRVSSRQPTTQADPFNLSIPAGPGNTLIRAANANRTYLTLRVLNTASGEDLRYDYWDNPNMLTEGFLLRAGDAIDLESPEVVYGRGTSVSVNMTNEEGQG